MGNFSMDWWYQQPDKQLPPQDGTTVLDPQSGDSVNTDAYPGSEGESSGSIGSGGAGDAVGSDPNSWWKDTSIAGNSSGNNYNWDNVLKMLASGAAGVGGGIFGALEGALLGGNLLTAAKQAMERGEDASGWMQGIMGNTIIGDQSGIMSPSSPDFLDPNTGQQATDSGIMDPGSEDFVPWDEGWIGRGQTNSGWAAGRPGMGSIGGGGSEKFPNWYASRIDRKTTG